MSITESGDGGYRSTWTALLVSLILLVLPVIQPSASAQPDQGSFRFVENVGQWPKATAFQGKAGDAVVRFSETGISYWFPVRNKQQPEKLRGYILSTEFVGASDSPRISGNDPAGGLHNYYLGNSADEQFTGAKDFSGIRYTDLYRGIEAVFSGKNGRMKYDFIVSPKGNPDDIEVRYKGARSLSINEKGELEIITEFGVVREARPYTYQVVDGKTVEIPTEYHLTGPASYGFSVGKYDHNRPLVIDPCLSIEYLTFLGAGGFDEVTSMAVDSVGNGYAVGMTRTLHFPTVPQQGSTPMEPFTFVSKISPDGSSLVYSTVFGPQFRGTYGLSPTGDITIHEPLGEAVAINGAGKAVVAFTTNTQGLTTTANAFQPARAPNKTNSVCPNPPSENYDAYVLRLGNNGAVEWATYLGGSDDEYVRDMAIDNAGNIAITGVTHAFSCSGIGDSLDFPITIPADSFSTDLRVKEFETFVAQLDPEGESLRFSALYGGRGNEFASKIAADPSGDLYIMGSTNSTDLKTTTGAYQETPNTGLSSSVYDLYIARIDPAAGVLKYNTYISDIGGNGRRGLGYGLYSDRRNRFLPINGLQTEERFQDMLLESDGVVIIGGSTRSGGLPGASGGLQGAPNNPNGSTMDSWDAYIMRFDMNAGAIVNATYLGGNGFDALGGLAFDNEGNIAIGVSTASTNYPLSRLNVQSELRGEVDGALTVLNPTLNGVEYSTYIGGGPLSGALLWEQSVRGVTSDNAGGIYVFGGTVSSDLPYTPNALSKENDFYGGWIAKMVAPDVPKIGVPLYVEFSPESCAQVQVTSQIIFNSGQAPLQIDDLKMIGGTTFFVADPPSLPLTLAPCDSLVLKLAFDPFATEIACDRTIRDTLIVVSSNAQGGNAIIPITGRKGCVSFTIRDKEVNDPRYRLGSARGYNLFAFVRGDVSQYVSIKKIPGGSNFIALRGTWDSVEVTTGVKTIDVNVNAPDTGYYCASFEVTVQPCDRKDTINVCAYVRSGFFNIDPTDYDLGLIGCRETEIPTKIWNSGNDTLEFRLWFVGGDQGEDVRYDIPWDSVRYLAPGDTFEFSTIYRPVGVGERVALPVYETNELPNPTVNHRITAELDTVIFELSIRDLEGAFDDALTLPIQHAPILDGRAPITEITLLAKFDRNALELEGVNRTGTLTDGWDVAESTFSVDGRIIRLVMGPSGNPLVGPGTLANLEFRVLRGDTAGSNLGVELAGISAGCLMAEIDSGFAFKLSEECLAHERLIFSNNRMLKQAYPNPARSAITIPFRVPKNDRVTMTLYDVTGRVMAILLDEEMSEGNNELRVNTSGLPPGLYYCRMVVGEVLTDTREVMIAE